MKHNRCSNCKKIIPKNQKYFHVCIVEWDSILPLKEEKEKEK